jgi:hypothetical protein
MEQEEEDEEDDGDSEDLVDIDLEEASGEEV